MFGNITVLSGKARNFTLSNSRIFNSRIDMGLQTINNVIEPVEGLQVANKTYVDKQGDKIASQVSDFFSGQLITLINTNYVSIGNFRVGSYLITINPEDDGNTSAMFGVSKSSENQAGYINRIMGTPNPSTGELLDLKWPAASEILLCKTMPGTVTFLVSFNVRNITNSVAPILESDVATKSYVSQQLQKYIDLNLSGIKVNLVGIQSVEVCNFQCGSYVCTVNPIQITNAPTAVFIISKNTVSDAAHIIKTTSLAGKQTLEELDLRWNANETITLNKSGLGYDGNYMVSFDVKNISSAPVNPIPSDVVTKDYLDNAISTSIHAQMGGIEVTLTGSAFTNVINQRSGSYFISVIPQVFGGPTGNFSVSKNKLSAVASVTRFTNTDGCFGCSLEITWLSNKVIQLRKTSDQFDGIYIVNMNITNMATPVPQNPTDICTVDYAHNLVETTFDAKFGGIKVQLIGTEFVSVISPRMGSMTLTISPLDNYGSTASFNISKSYPQQAASIVKVSQSLGKNSTGGIEVRWNENDRLYVRKTDLFNPGTYLLDFGTQNFATVTETIIDTDTASKSYVDEAIDTKMQAEFSGIVVNLQDMNFTQVTALQAGAYFITVKALGFPGPSMCCAIVKNEQCATAMVSIIVAVKGKDTGETLELVWPENSHLLLRKTGIFHNGEYLVDFSLKNFSTTPSPVLPSDICTKEYCMNLVEEKTKQKYGAIPVFLSGVDYAFVAPLKPGSYSISVFSEKYGSPSAYFAISKSKNKSLGHIVKLSSSPGFQSGEELSLRWDSDNRLEMNKTNYFYDSTYYVSFSLQNFTPTISPILDNELATKQFVIDTYNELLDTQFSGVSVYLTDTIWSDVYQLRVGSYTINISSEIGPSASFTVSKSRYSLSAHVVENTQQSGENNTRLELRWGPNEKLQLRKNTIFCQGSYVCDFNLRNIAAPCVQLESDVASKEYVREAIQEFANVKYGGIKVFLESTDFVQVAALKVGSYIVNVSPLQEGGATASFNISKSIYGKEGHIDRNTSMEGENHEYLELKWSPYSKLLLRKTGGNDMNYLVDLNLRNFETSLEPTLPSDFVTKSYMEEKLQELKKYTYEGVTVYLEGTTFVSVVDLALGSYTINVNSSIPGAPTSIFSCSKNSVNVPAHIVKVTSMPGVGSMEELEMEWDTTLRLRKTKLHYNGNFTVSFNVKNFNTIPTEPNVNLPVSVNYVNEAIEKAIQNKFAVLNIYLQGTEYTLLAPLSLGSYILTIKSNIDGGATAVFSLSKNKISGSASIVKITGMPGSRNEQLEMVWLPSEPVKIRKTLNVNNGVYTISFDQNNFSFDARIIRNPPIIYRTPGFTFTNLSLVGETATTISNLQIGSYLAIVVNSAFDPVLI